MTRRRMKTKRRLFSLFLFLFITAGCSDEDPGAEPTVTPALPQNDPGTVSSGTVTFFAIKEVGLGPEGFVALTNFTDTPASLAGLTLCQGSECFELPDVVVDPGETVRVAAGDGTGFEGVVATRATFGELRPADGEIALFASQELDDPQAILIYFQWGSTPHNLTQVAVDAGLWVRGGFGPSSQHATRLFEAEESALWPFEEP
jgi:hypothetical protein